METFKKFKRWLLQERLFLNWIQVEVSSFCNAQCIYCPRTIYKDNWSNRHMDIETFSMLIPFLENTKLVYLQGWGEPFLNPSIFEMIKMSKEKGTMVGLTSNATTIDTAMIEKIIKSGVDILALSLTGDAEGNDSIRKGTSYKKVLSVIDEFHRLKRLMNSTRPAINIAYLLLGKDLKGIYSLVEQVQNRGISQIVVSGLDFIACDSLLPQFTAYQKEELAILKELKGNANKKGISLITNLFATTKPQKLCTEDATKSLFVSSDGSVSPCVYMNLPIKDEVSYYIDGKKTYRRQTFGSLHQTTLIDLWYSKEYSKFRQGFADGNYNEMCKTCIKLYICDFNVIY